MPDGSFSWSTEKYIEEAEHGTDSGLLEYERVELNYLMQIKSLEEKTVVDVGAGYGRILPLLAKVCKKYIATERDGSLLEELYKRVKQLPNCQVIAGDSTYLSEVLSNITVENPLVISPQNTLGPWVGSRDTAIDEMRKVAEPRNGEVVISLFCREAIEDWGLPMYSTLTGLLGKYSSKDSDLKRGVFKTDRGYESYWFSKEETFLNHF